MTTIKSFQNCRSKNQMTNSEALDAEQMEDRLDLLFIVN